MERRGETPAPAASIASPTLASASKAMVAPVLDGKLSDPFTNIPTVNSKGQGGLLGVTIDPSFSNNRMVYWVFSQSNPDGNLTAVAKGKLSDDEKAIENGQVISTVDEAVFFPRISSFHFIGAKTN